MPGSSAFVSDLIEKNIPFMCLTNNSMKKRSDMALHLQDLGLKIKHDQVTLVRCLWQDFWLNSNPIVEFIV